MLQSCMPFACSVHCDSSFTGLLAALHAPTKPVIYYFAAPSALVHHCTVGHSRLANRPRCFCRKPWTCTPDPNSSCQSIESTHDTVTVDCTFVTKPEMPIGIALVQAIDILFQINTKLFKPCQASCTWRAPSTTTCGGPRPRTCRRPSAYSAPGTASRRPRRTRARRRVHVTGQHAWRTRRSRTCGSAWGPARATSTATRCRCSGASTTIVQHCTKRRSRHMLGRECALKARECSHLHHPHMSVQILPRSGVDYH